MQTEPPEKPRGRHVVLLREHLGLNQTPFAAILDVAQPTVSLWEHPDKRGELLPPGLAARFHEIWDCFPTRPAGGFTEVMAVMSAYRMRKTGVAPHCPDELPPGFMVMNYPEGKTGPRVLIEETGPRPPAGPPPSPTEGPPARSPPQEVAQLPGSGANSKDTAESNPNARRRRTVDAVLAACFACFTFATGCLLSHRTPNAQEPNRVSGELYMDNARDGNGDMGTARRSSIPMPEKAYSWQKLAPCQGGELEKVGGCWQELTKEPPPCPDYAVEDEGECLMPIPAKPKGPKAPKKPNTLTPEK